MILPAALLPERRADSWLAHFPKQAVEGKARCWHRAASAKVLGVHKGFKSPAKRGRDAPPTPPGGVLGWAGRCDDDQLDGSPDGAWDVNGGWICFPVSPVFVVVVLDLCVVGGIRCK